MASRSLLCWSAAIVPLVQTWLMGTAGPRSAGLVASVNISVAGLAGALGAGLGGAVLSGPGLAWISPIAAVPVLAATAVALALRNRTDARPAGTEPAGAATAA